MSALHNAHVLDFKRRQFELDSYTAQAALRCLRESSDDYLSERSASRRAAKGGAA